MQPGVEGGGGVSYRVKLYKLNNSGDWVDRGTGHIEVAFLEVTPCGASKRGDN